MLVFVCLCACFVSACLLSDVPGGDDGFPTEAVDYRLFCFYRFSSLLSGFSFSFCSVSSSLSLSPGPVQLYDMLYFVHKN